MQFQRYVIRDGIYYAVTDTIIEPRTLKVAVKEMKIFTGEAYDNHGNWKREAKALSVFNKLRDQHIVRGIGAFQYRGKRLIIMEWADEGDLKRIYLKHPNAHLDLTEERVAQFLQQFRGLANALNRMHDYKVVFNRGFCGPGIIPRSKNLNRIR